MVIYFHVSNTTILAIALLLRTISDFLLCQCRQSCPCLLEFSPLQLYSCPDNLEGHHWLHKFKVLIRKDRVILDQLQAFMKVPSLTPDFCIQRCDSIVYKD